MNPFNTSIGVFTIERHNQIYILCLDNGALPPSSKSYKGALKRMIEELNCSINGITQNISEIEELINNENND